MQNLKCGVLVKVRAYIPFTHLIKIIFSKEFHINFFLYTNFFIILSNKEGVVLTH